MSGAPSASPQHAEKEAALCGAYDWGLGRQKHDTTSMADQIEMRMTMEDLQKELDEATRAQNMKLVRELMVERDAISDMLNRSQHVAAEEPEAARKRAETERLRG